MKEYFQLILPKILSRAFKPLERDGHRWFWFSSPTEGRLTAYHAMGLLFGLALHNSVLVDPLFPHVLYKMLLTDMSKGARVCGVVLRVPPVCSSLRFFFCSFFLCCCFMAKRKLQCYAHPFVVCVFLNLPTCRECTDARGFVDGGTGYCTWPPAAARPRGQG